MATDAGVSSQASPPRPAGLPARGGTGVDASRPVYRYKGRAIDLDERWPDNTCRWCVGRNGQVYERGTGHRLTWGRWLENVAILSEKTPAELVLGLLERHADEIGYDERPDGPRPTRSDFYRG